MFGFFCEEKCGRSLQGQCFQSVRNKSLYRGHFRMLEKSLVYSFPSSRCFLVSNGHIFQCPCFQILLLSWYFLVRNVYVSSSRWFLALLSPYSSYPNSKGFLVSRCFLGSTDTIFQCPYIQMLVVSWYFLVRNVPSLCFYLQSFPCCPHISQKRCFLECLHNLVSLVWDASRFHMFPSFYWLNIPVSLFPGVS